MSREILLKAAMNRKNSLRLNEWCELMIKLGQDQARKNHLRISHEESREAESWDWSVYLKLGSHSRLPSNIEEIFGWTSLWDSAKKLRKSDRRKIISVSRVPREWYGVSSVRCLKMLIRVFVIFLVVASVACDTTDKVIIDNFGGDCSSYSLAVYKVTLEGHWSREIFPKHFPEVRPPAQFSKSFGVSHNHNFSLFKVESVASAGMKEFCETTKTDEWENQEINSKLVFDEFSIPKLSDPMDHVESRLFVQSNNSVISLVTKLIPSPDWFIGIDSLEVSTRWVKK